MKKEYFSVYAPNGDLVARVAGNLHPNGGYGHWLSSRTAWIEAGKDYTGTPEGISWSVLIKVGYKGVIETEQAA